MIYNKDANFPYPVLTNTSSNYVDCNFNLDIKLSENSESYGFELLYEIDSVFIKELLQTQQAAIILVIQSKDNKFYEVKPNQTFIEIPKSRITLSKRTVIQMMIKSKFDLNFTRNNDLHKFYDNFKDKIVVPKNSILGFSNTVLFDGSSEKPFDLFEKKVNPNIKSDIYIELGNETIIINYRNPDLQFIDSSKCNTLNNSYIYMGLQKALYRFIVNYGSDNEFVDLEEVEVPEDGLDYKIYNILKSKMVQEISVEKIDEAICLMSDKIIGRFASAIRGLYTDAN